MTDVTAPPPAGTVTMFTTSWCGYCVRLKGQMDQAGVAYREVNIEEHPEAVTLVEKVNDGNQTVPTLLFPDGSAATNPSLAQVQARLGG
ncbi:mycoredoxin [Cellulomonas bogoriensis]|uniref:Glutaredoxin n=1 Tax=Cellulomonas bogoriensis 69B4 = DSM 16987 TaxID=1386082 RepID=A0A0A0BQA8_9CELL|nr:mycoredoxin [Cellulomonas bogoriensis]KGM09239.1 glutaredoxin [Cellulomonas bogoriensis 69B4 = DSM 16987]